MLILDGYVRVSTDEQALDGVSLDAQMARIHGYSGLYGNDKENPFVIGEIVVDAGESAKTMKRPGLQRILRKLDNGDIGGVIVAKLDRLTRSLADWSFLIENYFGERKGRRLISVDNQVNTMNANGRLMLNLIVMIAQWEREIIAERTREALQLKGKRGERCGKVRYGFDLAEDGKHLIEKAAEQEVIRLMRRHAADGNSLRAIAHILEELGIETKEGNRVWTPATISRILKRTG